MIRTKKKLRFELSPELVDGDHLMIVDTKEAVIEMIEVWFDDADDCCEGFTVKPVMMSDEEIDAMPEVDL